MIGRLLLLMIASAVAAGFSQAARADERGVRVGRVDDTADAMAQPLTGQPADVARGREIVASRQTGLCLLCHTGPFPEERFQGNLAPDLSGAGSRWSAGQLRLRLVDAQKLSPGSMMPSYYRSDGLTRVGTAWQGKPVLTAQQIEDVVAFLQTLRD